MNRFIAVFAFGLALSLVVNLAEGFIDAAAMRPAGTAGFTPDEMAAWSEDR